MGINAEQFRELVVRPALQDMRLHSQAAEDLVVGTAAQESRLAYLKQSPTGPALGVFQIEPATYRDYWQNYLRRRRALRERILRDVGATRQPPPEKLITDLRFAAIMCRVHYLRIRAPLPDAGDVRGMAEYWKRYYNTHLGAGEVAHFVRSYRTVRV